MSADRDAGVDAQPGAAADGVVVAFARERTTWDRVTMEQWPVHICSVKRAGKGDRPIMFCFPGRRITRDDDKSVQLAGFLRDQEKAFQQHDMDVCPGCKRDPMLVGSTAVLSLELCYLPAFDRDGQVISLQFEFLGTLWCSPCAELLFKAHEQDYTTGRMAVSTFYDAWMDCVPLVEALQNLMRQSPGLEEVKKKEDQAAEERDAVEAAESVGSAGGWLQLIVLALVFVAFVAFVQRKAATVYNLATNV